MRKRTVIVLAAVAVVLGAFIFFFERHTLSSGDLEERRDRLLQSFLRDQVTKLEIEREGGRIVLSRELGEEGETTDFELVEPVHANADFDAVDTTMGALEWADARRTLTGVSAEDRRRFGLAEPRLRAFYTVADRRVPLAFGGEDPQESGVYLQLDDPEVVYVVGKDVYEALDHDASWFRDKALLADVDPSRAEALRLEGEPGPRALEKRADGWWLTAPAEGRADATKVSDLLRRLDEMNAQRFVADAPDGLAQYGLDPAAHTVHLARARGDGNEQVEATLRVGGPCAGHDAEVYARVGDGPVVCVPVDSVAPLDTPADELREKRLLSVRDDEVERIEIASGGSTLAVFRDEGAWKMHAHAGGRDTEGEADPQAVADFMRELRAVEAKSFVAADAAAVRSHGLTNPVATVTVFLASEGGGGEGEPRVEAEVTRVLKLGETSDGAFARRDDEPQLLEIDPSALSLVSTSPARFRSRRVVTEDEADLTRVTVRRASGPREVVERAEDGFRVVEPIPVAADGAVMRTVSRGLAALSAERFVAEQPGPAHGLDAPRLTVEARFEGSGDDTPPRTHVLRIGAETEGGAFARLDDDHAVFVVDRALVDALATPLADRDALAVDGPDIERIVIERGGRRETLRREGGGFVDEDGSAADIDTVVRALETLRASGTTGYGRPPPSAGLSRPRVTIGLTLRDGAPEPRERTIRIGAAEGEADDVVVHVRRDDLDVGYLVPAGSVAPLTER